ncbi:possible ABC antibiotics transporter [[Actinomadura] parvosata subsp. kistnae]|uniref:ABC transporter permease n=1 Tax=[Actinomadura] parvosata subsp. kistnae TaxID=1909395 RepID=A0A1U9ZZA9_9ACTN|nr:ABC transporter permease [Nonomuraea sp. ATCC 55076]AQZ63288.1 ABC transporter permease [Nonomuraea sp. ATCC 55076]SPL98977.1 possible ABC antibiotics transporter [Actinomadura parvosata subsp. kistnae]
MTGTLTLLRLALRRDRVLLPAWIVVIVGVVVASASAIAELYPQAGQRIALGVTIGAAPALQALTGPVFDASSVGGLTAWRGVAMTSVLAALMSLLTVIRHTRAEEETGRAELVGACAVGRHALAASAVLLAAAANLLIALLITVGLAGQGLPPAGALAFGLAVGGTGWVFTGVALLAAQLTEHARTARAIAAAALGLAFLLRALGDAAKVEMLAWLSPLGWAQRMRAFAGERWWVVALFAVAGAVLVAAAALVARRRDLGSGLVPARPGVTEAAPSLRSPMALAWRLQRGVLLGWSVGFAVVGLLFGALARSVGDIVGDNPQLAAILAAMGGAGALTDTFLAAELGLLGLVAGAYAVQATLRLQGEEAALRAEPVLATAVARRRWILSHLVMALGGSAMVLAAGGLAAGIAHGLRIGDPFGQGGRMLGAALVQVPATWTLAGIAMLLFGLLPRLTVLAWVALLAFALLGQLGELLQLADWVRDLSPFAHVPRALGQPLDLGPLLWLGAVTAALLLAGMTAFQRRDVQGG